jgi:uncharacterized protein (TIGR00255 family)
VVVLFSMTGYGEANFQSDALSVAIELRAVNNRYLKVTLRAAEPYNMLEPEFEKVVRRVVRRGTIQVHLRCQRQYAQQDFQINAVALRSYLTQLRSLGSEIGVTQGPGFLDRAIGHVLALPGVVPEPAAASFSLEEEWPVLERVLEQALGRMQAMRQEEGRAMAQDLLQQRDHIGRELAAIRAKVPQVTVAYRDRLLLRVQGLTAGVGVQISAADLIKDVINEPESAGRKLEFLAQEMSRETNTIGSKASDVEISRHVVEIKGALEKVRELVQNVE